MQEILGLDELGENGSTAVGGVSGVIHDRAVVFGETHEARVLDAIALIGGNRENNPLAHAKLRREANLIIRIRQPLDAFERALEIHREWLVFMADRAHALVQIAARKLVPQRLDHRIGIIVVESHLMEFVNEALLSIGRIR